MSESSIIAIVTGANKGIGKAIVRNLALAYNQQQASRGLLIYLTARSAERGQATLEELTAELKSSKILVPEGGKTELRFHELDITSDKSITSLAHHVEKLGGFNILVNNAAIAFKGDAFDDQVVQETLATNYFGTLHICEQLIPLIHRGGRVVNVSSTAGRLNILSNDLQKQFINPKLTVSELNALMNQFYEDVKSGDFTKNGWPRSAYGVSKVGLTALTFIHAREYKEKGLLINACCPGWVRTDMAGPRAPKTPDQGAQTPVLLALGDIGGVSGAFWKDGKQQNW